MRRETRRRKEENNSSNIFYIAGSLLAIGLISFIITFIVYGNKMDEQAMLDAEKFASLVQEDKNDDIEQISTQMGKTVEEAQSDLSDNETKTETSNKVTATTKKEENKNTVKTSNSEDKQTTETKSNTNIITFISPVEGETLKEYAKEKLVYSETLQEWTTHLGIDIKADKTSVVKASAKGTVKSIKNDPRYGLSIIIEHQDGYQTLYSNLLSSEFVQVGEQVEQGQSIGTVGDTAPFEIVDSPHLHFEISKDGQTLDPLQVIK